MLLVGRRQERRLLLTNAASVHLFPDPYRDDAFDHGRSFWPPCWFCRYRTEGHPYGYDCSLDHPPRAGPDRKLRCVQSRYERSAKLNQSRRSSFPEAPQGIFLIVAAALAAGTVAIVLNILVLDAFDTAGIVTARGGLQKLVRAWLSPLLTASGLSHSWSSLGLPGLDTPVFKTGFKVTVGLLMALAYALLFEPNLRGSFLRKGLVAAVFFWLLNACVVLPLLGEGIAGARTLTVGGLLSYAFAHTVFFIVLAWAYGILKGRLPARRPIVRS